MIRLLVLAAAVLVVSCGEPRSAEPELGALRGDGAAAEDSAGETTEVAEEFRRVEEIVLVEPARVEWRRVDCEPEFLAEGETQEDCWTLVEIPAMYETVTRLVPMSSAGRTDEGEDPATPADAPTGASPSPSSVPAELAGLPDDSQPGKVWCRVLIPARVSEAGIEVEPARREWRRNTACEVPGMAPEEAPPAPR